MKVSIFVCLLPIWNSNPLLVLQISAFMFYWGYQCFGVKELNEINLVPRVSLLWLLSRWNRDPGCSWSRDHLSIQSRRVGGYSSTFGREDDKIPPCCPTLPADFSTTQILGGHVTSRNQGLCSAREAEKSDPGNEVSCYSTHNTTLDTCSIYNTVQYNTIQYLY